MVLCLLYSPALTTIHEHWEDHSLDYMDLCHQSNVFVFQHFMNCIKRQKDMAPKDGSLRLEGVQFATVEEQKTTTNSPRKNEVVGPKWKRCSVVEVYGAESKVQCCKEKRCIGT